MTEEIWKLYASEEPVADLAVKDRDFPWITAELRPEPGFERFRPLFDELHAATDDERWDDFEATLRRISADLRMTDGDGREIVAFLLQIQGAEAWRRYSYTPI